MRCRETARQDRLERMEEKGQYPDIPPPGYCFSLQSALQSPWRLICLCRADCLRVSKPARARCFPPGAKEYDFAFTKPASDSGEIVECKLPGNVYCRFPL